MNSAQWIDLVRRKTATGSDYAVAKLLGLSEDAVHGYRKGTSTLGPEAQIAIARVLAIPLERIALDIQDERRERKALKGQKRRRGQRALFA